MVIRLAVAPRWVFRRFFGFVHEAKPPRNRCKSRRWLKAHRTSNPLRFCFRDIRAIRVIRGDSVPAAPGWVFRGFSVVRFPGSVYEAKYPCRQIASEAEL